MLSERRPPTANSRVTAFLESQRGLMSYYAAEGNSVAATWPKQSSGDSRPGSPMLVPRAAAAKDDGPRNLARSTAPDEPVLSFPIDTDESLISQSQKPRPANPSKSTRAAPIKLRASQRKSMDQDKCSDDEPERLQRLEQRRNRRRARRYAMGVAQGATSRGDNASETDLSPKTNIQQKSQSTDKIDKKKGRAKVTPALLLMQNFSSQSLGKSRLTMRPSPTIGVFNKGKNSGKIMKKGERTGRLVPDIVFSESRFLNKVPSAHNIEEDTEDDSDCSNNHSAHSLTERSRLQKNRVIKSSQTPNHKVIMDEISRSVSPAHSSRSTREESPPWDIEETLPSSPSSAKSVNFSTDNVSPTAQKDITVSTARSAWASKLRNPGPHTPVILDDTNSAPGSQLTQVPPAQPRTTSTYFAPIDSQEPQAPVASPIELDGPEDKKHGHRVDSYPIAPLDPVNPPSTPECLQLEHVHLLSDSGNGCMSTPGTCLPLTGTVPSWSPSAVTNPQDDDIQYGSDYEIGTEREVRNYFTQEQAKCVDWSNNHIRNDPDILGLDPYARPCNIFSSSEVEFHEIHSDLDYDVQFNNEANYSNDEAEYPYEDCEDFYTDTAYMNRNMGVHKLLGEYDDLGSSDKLEEGISLRGLGNHELYVEDLQEQESYHPDEWFTTEDNTAMEYLDPAQVDPELDDTACEDQFIETDVEWTEQTPRLVRVITESSLQDDLVKSMNGHWSAAHRLY
ncbi:unnamed protein product [Rhizoctonia solani]|uniref:Uncharacterized protein n=1 Tax=Rhizoctonia solani TaxID=456999 RepID=A0A8H3B8I8_9AGAM|nr:unnamed protein product [Rhizoctonia solani]